MKNNVRNERKKINMTQENLAILIGVSRQTINAIETEKYNPSVLLALKLSKILKVSVDELFIIEQND